MAVDLEVHAELGLLPAFVESPPTWTKRLLSLARCLMPWSGEWRVNGDRVADEDDRWIDQLALQLKGDSTVEDRRAHIKRLLRADDLSLSTIRAAFRRGAAKGNAPAADKPVDRITLYPDVDLIGLQAVHRTVHRYGERTILDLPEGQTRLEARVSALIVNANVTLKATITKTVAEAISHAVGDALDEALTETTRDGEFGHEALVARHADAIVQETTTLVYAAFSTTAFGAAGSTCPIKTVRVVKDRFDARLAIDASSETDVQLVDLRKSFVSRVKLVFERLATQRDLLTHHTEKDAHLRSIASSEPLRLLAYINVLLRDAQPRTGKTVVTRSGEEICFGLVPVRATITAI